MVHSTPVLLHILQSNSLDPLLEGLQNDPVVVRALTDYLKMNLGGKRIQLVLPASTLLVLFEDPLMDRSHFWVGMSFFSTEYHLPFMIVARSLPSPGLVCQFCQVSKHHSIESLSQRNLEGNLGHLDEMHFFHGNSALHFELPKPSDEILVKFIFTLLGIDRDGVGVNWSEIMTQMYKLAEVSVKTNYYGARKMTKAPLLLQLSDSPRVVNLSSSMGSLKHIPNEWANGVLSDAEKLTEDRIDDVLNEFLKDFKEDILETKGWPTSLSAYILSTAAVNAFTRMMARKYPNICINSVVKTNMNFINIGMLISIAKGAESIVRLALVPNGSHFVLYFYLQEVSPF
ncbi:unnamed protein product [Prunus armeniaca]